MSHNVLKLLQNYLLHNNDFIFVVFKIGGKKDKRLFQAFDELQSFNYQKKQNNTGNFDS